MLGKLLQPEIQEALRTRDFETLRAALVELPVPDAVEILIDIPDDDEAILFRLLPRKFAAEVFAYLPPDDQEVLLRHLSTESLTEILNAIPPDDRTRLLEELPGEVTQRLLAMLSPQELKVARQLLGYPEDSVGRLMTPEYVAVRKGWTVGQALEHIRKVGREAETLHVVYVVDEKGTLLDDLRLGALVLADPGAKIADLIDEQFVSLSPFDDQESAVAAFKKYDRVALPVVDAAGLLLGIVTVDDVLDVATEEAGEDIQKLGGMQAIDEPYLQVGLRRMIRKRGGWLSVLFLGELLTATAMTYFEHEVARAVVLILFIPLIISSGGNSGSQASTLVVRAIALGEVRLRDWWRVVRREIPVGLALGSVLGVLGFLRVEIWQAVKPIYGEHHLLVALTVLGSLVGVVLFGSLAGSMLPFLLRRFGLDPASASAPFVATLVDVTGLVIYFTVASLVLRGTLL
ncbi:MAG TPA: magnesium transporter [Planctomycetota bacterium]|jgi:magnesium transporter|nr:magnesium transporter [Planctomycetota bacterium]